VARRLAGGGHGAAQAELARRYLDAYGPATRGDFARWFGMDPRPARELFEGLAGAVLGLSSLAAGQLTNAQWAGTVGRTAPMKSGRRNGPIRTNAPRWGASIMLPAPM
jgi:hypothetical protein